MPRAMTSPPAIHIVFSLVYFTLILVGILVGWEPLASTRAFMAKSARHYC